jgi:MFS family permease
MRSFLPIAALLTSAGFLLAANGLHGLLLPLRATGEGFTTTQIGLMGTGWAVGFVLSSLLTPLLVRRAGHIRAFAAFSAMAAIIALINAMIISPVAWMVLRGCSGFVMAGGMMVVESWLNERATNDTRGTVFGIYMTVNFASITGGQFLVAVEDPAGDTLFMLASILFCLAVLPTALSTAATPKPLTQVRLNLKHLYYFSPVAFVSAVLIGTINGAFGTLAPVFGWKSGMPALMIAMMMGLSIMAGAIMQIPIGRLSDRTDRRYVLAGGAIGACLAGAMIVSLRPTDPTQILILTAIYGALTYPLYSLAVAHANDFAASSDFVAISGGLLMLYGVGTMIGPTAASVAMERFGPAGLFTVTATAHFVMAGHAIYRTMRRKPIPEDQRESFSAVPAQKALTPETAVLDPRAEEEVIRQGEPEMPGDWN